MKSQILVTALLSVLENVSEYYAPLDIRCAELGNDAGLYGAAQYAYDCL